MTLNIGFGLLDQLVDIARRAGEEILKVYHTNFQVTHKADASPLTAADQAAEAVILNAIREEISDQFPIVGEEAFAEGHAPEVTGRPFWLVDPLDGTKEFVKRNDEFTVNIALIETSKPAAGVVYAPALGLCYWGAAVGAFAREGNGAARAIACRRAPAKGLVAMTSRHHTSPEVDTYLAKLPIGKRVTAGSSLKFCRIAEGKADVYPRFGRTMEWDTAAGHAILRFAGGHIVDLDGRELRYGKPGFENPGFIAHGPGVPTVQAQATQ